MEDKTIRAANAQLPSEDLMIQRVKRTSLLGGRLVLVAHGCQLGLPLLGSLAALLLLLLALGRVLLQPVQTKPNVRW